MHPRRFGRVVCQFVGTSIGEVQDMSAGGMRVQTVGARAPQIDDVVKVQLVGISGIVEVRCRIAWVKSGVRSDGLAAKIRRILAGARHEVGLEFIDLTPEARTVIAEIGAAAGKNETIRPDIERFRSSAA